MGDLLRPWHVILIALVILLLFGGKKIPELMRGIGKGVKEFKDAQKGDEKPADTEKKPDDKNEEVKK
jgi:sec-independent protein translocase protein TatA